MSTAVSTLMPTSAACSAGASLMPSPMKPTVCLVRLKHPLDDAFPCALATREKRRETSSSAASASSGSLIFSTASPEEDEIGPGRPTSLQTLREQSGAVARDDLDRDAEALKRPGWPRRPCPSAGRGRRCSPRETQVALVGLSVECFGSVRPRLGGSPSSLVASASTRKPSALSRSCSLFRLLDVWVIHGADLAAEPKARTLLEDLAPAHPWRRCDLCLPAYERRPTRSPSREVEWDLRRQLAEVGHAGVRMGLLVREHRAVEEVLEAGLKVAVDVGQREHVPVPRAARRRSTARGQSCPS